LSEFFLLYRINDFTGCIDLDYFNGIDLIFFLRERNMRQHREKASQKPNYPAIDHFLNARNTMRF
jgi:hypothetical protein